MRNLSFDTYYFDSDFDARPVLDDLGGPPDGYDLNWADIFDSTRLPEKPDTEIGVLAQHWTSPTGEAIYPKGSIVVQQKNAIAIQTPAWEGPGWLFREKPKAEPAPDRAPFFGIKFRIDPEEGGKLIYQTRVSISNVTLVYTVAHDSFMAPGRQWLLVASLIGPDGESLGGPFAIANFDRPSRAIAATFEAIKHIAVSATAQRLDEGDVVTRIIDNFKFSQAASDGGEGDTLTQPPLWQAVFDPEHPHEHGQYQQVAPMPPQPGAWEPGAPPFKAGQD